MRREVDIIPADPPTHAVRLGGREPRRLLAAAEYAASIGLEVWIGPELWNATPQRTLHYITEAAAASVRRVYGGPVSYCALPFERVDWDRFDVVGVNYYRQFREGLTTDQYLARISQLQATGK